ncbi:unnamed protein product, partial [Polarella glacialis]
MNLANDMHLQFFCQLEPLALAAFVGSHCTAATFLPAAARLLAWQSYNQAPLLRVLHAPPGRSALGVVKMPRLFAEVMPRPTPRAPGSSVRCGHVHIRRHAEPELQRGGSHVRRGRRGGDEGKKGGGAGGERPEVGVSHGSQRGTGYVRRDLGFRALMVPCFCDVAATAAMAQINCSETETETETDADGSPSKGSHLLELEELRELKAPRAGRRRTICLTDDLSGSFAERCALSNRTRSLCGVRADPKECKGDVSLCVRLRPGFEEAIAVVEGKNIRLRAAAVSGHLGLAPSRLDGTGSDGVVCCDHAFGTETSQEQVFDKAVAPITDAVIRGYNGAVIAYGQTGAGKTHTMIGAKTGAGRGIAGRAVEAIFSGLARRASWRVEVSVLEVYNEKVRDLLAPGSNVTTVEIHEIREREGGPMTFRCPDATAWPARSPEDALAALAEGVRRREVARTDMNHCSSRSHLVFSLNVSQSDREAGATLRSRLHLVDLAGSERLKRSMSMDSPSGRRNGSSSARAVQVRTSLTGARSPRDQRREGCSPTAQRTADLATSSEAAAAFAGAKPREFIWDNLKGICVLLVVLVHSVMALCGQKAYLSSKVTSGLASVLVFVVMPGGALVSGHLSSADLTERRLVGLARTWVVAIIQQLIWTLVYTAISQKDPTIRVSWLPLPFFNSAGHLWFIMCLAVWRTLLPLLSMLRWPVVTSIIISTLVLFMDSSRSMIFQPVFTFLPFFMA